MDVLVFELADAKHALPMENVREVVRAVAVTPLPNAPSVIEGIINVRGTVTAVLSLRGRFDYPERPVNSRRLQGLHGCEIGNLPYHSRKGV